MQRNMEFVEMSWDWPPPSAYKKPSFPTSRDLKLYCVIISARSFSSSLIHPTDKMDARDGTRADSFGDRLLVLALLVEDPSSAVIIRHLER